MSRRKMVVIIVILATLLMPLAVQAETLGAVTGGGHGNGPGCHMPESNADALEILSNYYPGYWWDHTNLTVAVQAHPNATQPLQHQPA